MRERNTEEKILNEMKRAYSHDITVSTYTIIETFPLTETVKENIFRSSLFECFTSLI